MLSSLVFLLVNSVLYCAVHQQHVETVKRSVGDTQRAVLNEIRSGVNAIVACKEEELNALQKTIQQQNERGNYCLFEASNTKAIKKKNVTNHLYLGGSLIVMVVIVAWWMP